MRTVSAWLVGILTLLVVSVGIGHLGEAIGIPPAIHHNEPMSREVDGEHTEFDSSPTSFGYSTMIFSFVVGIWAGQATFAKSLWAGFTTVGKLTFLAWLMATALLLPAGAVVDLAVQNRHGSAVYYIRLLLEIGIMAGIGWACRQWWKNRVAKAERGAAYPLAQAERRRQATRPAQQCRLALSAARAWRTAVVARLARTLGRTTKPLANTLRAPGTEHVRPRS